MTRKGYIIGLVASWVAFVVFASCATPTRADATPTWATHAEVARLAHRVNDQQEYIDNLMGGNRQWIESCVPTNTGGGVTQCAQPTTFDSAIVACFDNIDAYIGVTTEDTFHLLHQCVFDYLESRKGW